MKVDEVNRSYMMTDIERSRQLLVESNALESSDEKVKLLEEAIELDKKYFEAKIDLAMMVENDFAHLGFLNMIVEEAEEFLVESEGLNFDESDLIFGDYLSLEATEGYMSARVAHLMGLITVGYIYEAIFEATTLLQMDVHDHLGVRYILQQLYYILNEEERVDEFASNFNDDNFQWKFPYALMMFDNGKVDQAKDILDDLFERYEVAKLAFLREEAPIEDLSNTEEFEEVYLTLLMYGELLNDDFMKFISEHYID